jgi:DNA repair exonuclease SbcCD nuclease subunit
LLHQGINGYKDGGWVCDNELDADEVCNGWDLVFAGHFHDRQDFGGVGQYVGAPMQHDFRDAGSESRGVVIVTFESGRPPEISFKSIDSPRFVVHRWETNQNNFQTATQRWGIRAGDYLRIDVESTSEVWGSMGSEVGAVVKHFELAGVHVMPPKHLPIVQVETRLGFKSPPSFEDAITRYVRREKPEALDLAKLIEIAKRMLHEVERG